MPKILLVEDEEQIRSILVRRLQKRQFEVVIAADGEKACAMAKAELPDVILMDIGLEGSSIDGLEATRRLKAEETTQRIPVIALTAHAVSGWPEKIRDAGCDDYETKPIEFPRLLEKIQMRLQGSAAP